MVPASEATQLPACMKSVHGGTNSVARRIERRWQRGGELWRPFFQDVWERLILDPRKGGQRERMH